MDEAGSGAGTSRSWHAVRVGRCVSKRSGRSKRDAGRPGLRDVRARARRGRRLRAAAGGRAAGRRTGHRRRGRGPCGRRSGADPAAEPSRSRPTGRHGTSAGAARALDALEADLVHVQWAPSAYGWSGAVGWLPALLRTPVVTTLHEYGWWGWPGWVPSAVWPVVERAGRYDRESGLLGPRSRALVVTNEGHAAVVRARLNREPTLIPLGPNVPAPGPDADGARAARTPSARAGRRGAAAGVLRVRAPGQGRPRADRRHGAARATPAWTCTWWQRAGSRRSRCRGRRRGRSGPRSSSGSPIAGSVTACS